MLKNSERQWKAAAFFSLGIIALFILFAGRGQSRSESMAQAELTDRTVRVCPPFFLRDETGDVINPITGENADQPYSPRQTCGACHDYAKVTEGYHFQQGADEGPPKPLGERAQWVSTPGNYGGAWCSPAPLYPYLSAKRNQDPQLLDMTSFTFVTRGCGKCHPGGGPLEFDREGKRYDTWMSDPASGFASGGENDLDGDYYKARWSESGVLEADCLLCHLPAYDFGVRNKQLSALNFRWAASAAAGLARVEGSVAASQPVSVAYDRSRFDAEGRLSLPMVVSPRNEACLQCHAQPGWKKRGADFRARTDVHLRAGMRCVDCHPAGSRADDPRIRDREAHQIAKGDDPGGKVRNDLNNTMRDCANCHDTGNFGAPIARHENLPEVHLHRIACQTCHTPEKTVMPIQVQASDVFNADAFIAPGGKQLWTFYGVDGKYRNHYGVMKMMGYDDKPTEKFRPVLARYKGNIYPVNRVHSTWPAIETPGQPGLMQPRSSDIHKMWKEHRENPDRHPELSKITDDNGDGIIEVNRPEEIDALIAAITNHLTEIGYPLKGKRVVWVMNNRVYLSGNEHRELPMEPWEASPYGNVHKYNHDIQPARAALGANGCTDCHRSNAPFFTASVLLRPFDENGDPVWMPNHELLGISSLSVRSGAFREAILKPAAVWMVGLLLAALLLHYVIAGRREALLNTGGEPLVERLNLSQRLVHFIVLSAGLVLGVSGLIFFSSHRTLNSGIMRDLHAWTGIVFAAGWIGMIVVWAREMLFVKGDLAWLRAGGGYFQPGERLAAGKFNAGQKVFFWVIVAVGIVLVITGIALVFLRNHPSANLSLLYTFHDLGALIMLALMIAHLYMASIQNPNSMGSIFGGRVSRQWLSENHPHVPGVREQELNHER